MKKNYSQNSFLKQLKRPLYTTALFLFALGAKAQISSFPWTETFEDSSTTRAGWTQIYEVNNMSWTFATGPSTGGYIGGASSAVAYEGTKFANYPGTSHDFDKTKLVSPPLNLSAVTSPSLSFYYRNPYWNPDQNWLRIFYRISATDPWVQLAEFHTNVPTWAPSGDIFFPNTAYQIAIECETDYGYSTTVDSFVVTGALGVNQFLKSTISFYPNPAENVLNFSSHETVTDINVFNTLGQKVMENKVNANEGQIDISNLAAGAYIVRGNTASGTQVFRVVKK